MQLCLLCSEKSIVNAQDNASRTIYNCPNCGVYVVSDIVIDDVKKNAGEVAAFFMSRKASKLTDSVLVSYEKSKKDKDYIQLTVKQIVNQFPKNFTERMDMSLRNLAYLSEYAGFEIQVENLAKGPLFYLEKQNLESLSYTIKSLQKADLIEVNYYGKTFFPCGIIITPKGWNRISELGQGKGDCNNALLILPQKDEPWSVSMRLASRKAVQDCGLRDIESAAVSAEGVVDFTLIGAIKRSKLVICDLSSGDGESYYAAAMARALGKITILICNFELKKNLRINTSQFGVIFWKDGKSFYNELYNTISVLKD